MLSKELKLFQFLTVVRPELVLTIQENNDAPDTVLLQKDENSLFQKWKRKNLDEVDDWFTLFNVETEMYLSAKSDSETITESKSILTAKIRGGTFSLLLDFLNCPLKGSAEMCSKIQTKCYLDDSSEGQYRN